MAPANADECTTSRARNDGLAQRYRVHQLSKPSVANDLVTITVDLIDERPVVCAFSSHPLMAQANRRPGDIVWSHQHWSSARASPRQRDGRDTYRDRGSPTSSADVGTVSAETYVGAGSTTGSSREGRTYR